MRIRSSNLKLVQYSCSRRQTQGTHIRSETKRTPMGKKGVWVGTRKPLMILDEFILAEIVVTMHSCGWMHRQLHTSDSLLIVAGFLFQLLQLVFEDTADFRLLIAPFLSSAPFMVSFPLSISHPSGPR